MKSFLLATFFQLLLVFTAQSQIVISEIMYNPPESGTDSLEYVEIFNAGNSDVDLQNYSLFFANATRYTFATSYNFPSKTYLVFAVNSAAVKRQFKMTATPIAWTSSGLSNTGTTIKILNGSNITQDSVSYISGWQTTTNGNGSSLLLCNVNSDNSVSSNWGYSTASTGNTINNKLLYGSPGTAESCQTLPLTWNNSKAKLSLSTQLETSWNVVEQGVSYYEIETSVDGKSFSSIDKIIAKGDGVQDYIITTSINNQFPSKLYVRIKEVDQNGGTNYSEVMVVDNPFTVSIKVSPNPVLGTLTITLPESLLNTKLTLLDANGKTVKVIYPEVTTYSFDMSLYPSGIYVLQSSKGETVKIIKL